MKTKPLIEQLERIATALERAFPAPPENTSLDEASGYLWSGETRRFTPIAHINAIELEFLIGIDLQIKKLLANTKAFKAGYPANNALLWGARGMGKSSLVKAIHQQLNNETPENPLILIEILREDIASLSDCLSALQAANKRFILFCDDLSFDQKDNQYKTLKAMLEGGITGRPDNVIFYATSNQRHLLRRDQSEYESRTALSESDISNETISLSDRFGLWLGFHNCTPDEFKEMILKYAAHYKIPLDEATLLREAHQWSMERGARSGRVAWQFTRHLLGVHKIKPGP